MGIAIEPSLGRLLTRSQFPLGIEISFLHYYNSHFCILVSNVLGLVGIASKNNAIYQRNKYSWIAIPIQVGNTDLLN